MPAFPWMPEYENGIHHWGSSGESERELGIIGRGIVAVSHLIISSVELYLLFFVTCVVTVLYNGQ
jgi:hypothetical protein